MDAKQRQIKARETWIRCYEQLGSVSKAARKCGIPRSTLYRWIKRFKDNGKDALKGHSTRPKVLAKQKVSDELVTLIKAIRVEYNFGPQRISLHLLRVHNIDISAPTVWRVIKGSGMSNIKNIGSMGI
ncbi:helix-turn-helix domain-containing protein [Niabella hibiscisoli]|uniref:helix-turn-helix domain-containing protein n=1 Tax=Niabella hibiscisoli TaxID=1825928 RepID=UPI00374D8A6C